MGDKPETVAVPTTGKPASPRAKPMPAGETWAAVKGADDYADMIAVLVRSSSKA